MQVKSDWTKKLVGSIPLWPEIENTAGVYIMKCDLFIVMIILCEK